MTAQPARQTEPPNPATFYAPYRWSLNIYPTIEESIRYLETIVGDLQTPATPWIRREQRLNIALLACAISDSADDVLAGPSYDFSKITGAVAFAAPFTRLLSRALLLRSPSARSQKDLTTWRDEWEIAVVEYLRAALLNQQVRDPDVLSSASRLVTLSKNCKLPPGGCCKAPAAFRSQDLTHFDAITLARRLAAEVPDKTRPILVLGCRTAGSYLAPFVRAQLSLDGYERVDSATIRPKKPASEREASAIALAAARGGAVVLVDEPVNTGSTLVKAIQTVVSHGTDISNIVVLLPVHASRRNWATGADAAAISAVRTVLLQPEDWYKHQVLDNDYVAATLAAIAPDHFTNIHRVEIDQEISAQLERSSELKFHSRLKRAFLVHATDIHGRTVVRKVIVKSAGWGWYSYHAALGGEALEGFVPVVYGLRDGLLFSEWMERNTTAEQEAECARKIPIAAASYIARRTTKLALQRDPVPALALANQHKGTEELAGILSKAYGSKAGALLGRPALAERVSSRPCPFPTLIDGRMRPAEWIGQPAVMKTDFEHHGLGKTELCVTDPAYDIADTVLQWQLTPGEERDLIAEYRRQTGDEDIESRLFLYKLLAGTWNMSRALDNLADQRLAARHRIFNRDYITALAFLVEQTTRYCGAWTSPPAVRSMTSPVVFIDIDGVIDKQIFGFPANSAAGIKALSLLNRHGYATVINSARSVDEARVYAESYGCTGAVSEYGGHIWDRATGREMCLVDEESASQLREIRRRLLEIPGVFLDDRYRHILRAFLYVRGVTVPVPTPVIEGVLTRAQASRIKLHQTFTDSTLVSAGADKGIGLRAFLDFSGIPHADSIAIGDSEPDLAMFKVAGKSYAPSHISCRAAARLLGTSISKASYQKGFLESVNRLIHPDGSTCSACADEPQKPGDDLFYTLLAHCDVSPYKWLLRNAFDLRSLAAFRR